ncbi:hypothetical protein N0V83_006097 [Neocucurbitaria cava]|uniref:Uncharacterized protein n=1 Tax=Neocucurbitaria cava TaxID=798079 RepID=A0A9W9CLN0_9PLEO|nr:hypothetical protein N0V83_006097 [Neocucurbitaria cava]
MEPQRPPVPYPATYSQQSQQYYPPSPNTPLDEYNYVYNEKDAYEPQQSIRTGRGSKSSNCRGRDSQAYLDPEKHGSASSQGRSSRNRAASGLDPDAVVYDQGEYHEKGPEEKVCRLLVSNQHMKSFRHHLTLF